MARPARIPLQAGQASWDADVSDNFRTIFDGPLPIFEDATVYTLATLAVAYPPGDYDRCIMAANLNDGALVGYYVCFSSGTAWKALAFGAP